MLAPSYAAAAHQIGEALRAAYHKQRPVDRAADEIELAMLHGGYSVQHSLRKAALRVAKHVPGDDDGRVLGGAWESVGGEMMMAADEQAAEVQFERDEL